MNLKELARKAVSTLFLSMLCLVAFAQTATGLVKDKTGEPMIGVNVLVKGTTNGTITVSIRPRACFFPLFSFLPLWLHYNLNPLCVQY